MSQGDRELVRRFWKETPLRALWPLLVAVFSTFACFGFLVDVGHNGRHPWPALAVLVGGSGLIAMAFVLIAVRQRYWLFVPAIGAQLALTRLDRLWPYVASGLTGDALRTRLLVDAWGTIAGLVAGYVFFMMFIVRQGLRRVRTDAEMALAREIHVSLVPDVTLETPGCEVYGRSLPASEVGGDLVDALVVEAVRWASSRTSRATACRRAPSWACSRPACGRASALRPSSGPCSRTSTTCSTTSRARTRSPPPRSFAWRRIRASPTRSPATRRSCTCGAPTRAVTRLSEGGMALGIQAGERYPVGHADVRPGDVLAVLTDGFTETMDRQDHELGMAPSRRPCSRTPVSHYPRSSIACSTSPAPTAPSRTTERCCWCGSARPDSHSAARASARIARLRMLSCRLASTRREQAMALNIRNAEAERLAEALAKLAGETKTEAVTRALRDRLSRLRREKSGRRLADELDEIAKHCSRLPVRDSRTPDEILGYDEHGVPR